MNKGDNYGRSKRKVKMVCSIFTDGCRVETSEPVTAKEMKEIFCDMGTATVFEPISEQEYKDMSEE